ncbi:MAG TPA: aspartate aminotransferase family protein [Candidatus Sulfotelmatobacter sp.]|nr:aspartate aminotransferase family protein [Candidatus Sulfotelmatobacter sp.]
MTTPELLAASAKYLANTYARFPVVLVRGTGMRLWDSEGKEYLDFAGGIAVDALGHCHPRMVEAIRSQAERLIHVSNLYHIEPQIRLAKLLCEHSFADRAFFCNSGAEANEAAIKLARKYAKDHWSTDRVEIIAAQHAFHGRTLATLTATGKYTQGFEPLVPGFKHVPYNDLPAVARALDSRTCAVLVEPIQGEGGVVVPDEGYLPGLRRLCDEAGVLLIFDEVQTGMGRTGRLFAYEHSGIAPDIMTLAKALAGGVPIGAMLAKETVATSFTPGTHATTFGGTPFVTAVALAVVETILVDDLAGNAGRVGKILVDRLAALQGGRSVVTGIRGKGLLVGVDLSVPARPVVSACLERGLLVLSAGDTVLRFAPPLIASEADVDQALAILTPVLRDAAA